MSLQFTREQKESLAEQIRIYFRDELDKEIGNMEAEFFLDFLTEQLGPTFYNKALKDVQSHLHGFTDELLDRIDELQLNESS